MLTFISGTYYDLDQLASEMTLGGLLFITPLGTDGTTIYSYTAAGAFNALPAGAGTFIAAHVPSHLARDLAILAAQPAVGLQIRDLDDEQVRAVLACMLYRLGAIDQTSWALRPIEEWLLQ